MYTETKIPYFSIDDPFHLVYRNNSTSHLVLPHTHNGVEFFFTLTDLPDVLLNDQVSGVSKGSLIVIPPYNVHQLFNQSLTVYERYILSINSEWLQYIFHHNPSIMNYADRTATPLILRLSEAQQTRLIRSYEDFLKNKTAFDLNCYVSFFTLLSQVDRIIHECLSSVSVSLRISGSQKIVNEIISYINEHLCEDLSLDSIAAHFYMNKDYLGRLFKTHTHATMGHYIAMQKTSKAQLLLQEGQSVTQVQEYLGFSSYSYFFKFFKKMTGISPSHYRKINYHI